MGRVPGMNEVSCEYWQGILAMEVIGRAAPGEITALRGHLEGCSSCRAASQDLLPVAEALSMARPDYLDDDLAVPRSLAGSVHGELGRRAARARRLVRARSGAIVAAVAAAVAVTVTLVVLHPAATAPGGVRTVALSGVGGLHGTVSLIPERWGTKVVLDEVGPAPNEMLSLSMGTNAGLWWPAGSYSGVGNGHVRVTMACGVPVSQLTGVRVTDSAGHEVLRGAYAD